MGINRQPRLQGAKDGERELHQRGNVRTTTDARSRKPGASKQILSACFFYFCISTGYRLLAADSSHPVHGLSVAAGGGEPSAAELQRAERRAAADRGGARRAVAGAGGAAADWG